MFIFNISFLHFNRLEIFFIYVFFMQNTAGTYSVYFTLVYRKAQLLAYICISLVSLTVTLLFFSRNVFIGFLVFF